MPNKIIGREEEITILEKLLASKDPELLAIYGRRRIGKTYLIKTFFKPHLLFTCSGQSNGKTEQQLINFTEQLNTYFPKEKNLSIADNWQEAFSRLKASLETVKQPGKKVLFFDELPWLDNHKSGFLSSFSYFWNTYASDRKDLLVVICGSAASWIINKLVNNKGGLHNRITRRIRLLPFNLKETENYLQYKNIHFDRYQLLQLYMTMGGVPAYLNAVERGKSVAQNIETICFSKDGALAKEFNNLYSALFNSPEKHIQVIRALTKKNKGLTRNEILNTGRMLTGGNMTTVLNELTESGFIEQIYPYAKKEKDSLYRLSDEFSLFYFKFMHNQRGNEKNQWVKKQSTLPYITWCGYAFENICFRHISKIKNALQIAGIQSGVSSWLKPGNKEGNGAQIDLLIDRADQCINVCEMKFSSSQYTINKKYAAELTNKISAFRDREKYKKAMFLTFITTYGVADNQYKEQLVDAEITMNALFIS